MKVAKGASLAGRRRSEPWHPTSFRYYLLRSKPYSSQSNDGGAGLWGAAAQLDGVHDYLRRHRHCKRCYIGCPDPSEPGDSSLNEGDGSPLNGPAISPEWTSHLP
jgi:hypothetical protein